MKKLLNKIKERFSSFAKFAVGPTYHIENRKIAFVDKNNFAILTSLIFSIAFLAIFRGDAFFPDIKAFICYPFVSGTVKSIVILGILGLLLIFLVAGSIILHRRKYVCVMDAILTYAFVLAIMFFIFGYVNYPVTEKNWLIWLIMALPQLFLIFFLGIRAFRFLLKFFGSDSILTARRSEDYEYLRNRERRTLYRFGLYLKGNWGQLLILLAMIALCIMVLYPLGITVLRSFRVWVEDAIDPFGIPQEFTFENYKAMWDMLSSTFLNSLITAISVTAGATVFASMLAFAFIRFNFPLKNVLFYMIIGLMMIPGLLSLVARYDLVFKLGLVGSLWGIILPGMIGYVPGAFMLLFTFFRGLPKDLFEAADVDGSNNLGIYMKIVLPLSKPIMSTIIITTFVGEWNDYLWAYLITNGNEAKYTLPVYLNFLSDMYVENMMTSILMAGYIISALPLVLIFAVASKQFIEGLTSGAFKM